MSKNNIPDMLLAKSKRGDIVVSLQRHLLETEQTSKEIFCLDKRWGRSWCRFFKLSTKNQQEKFLLNLRVAALFHDMGKANEEFYLAVSSPNRFAQTLRHEH
ncbi:MAG: CRISPR-associated helicase/endonuclease Cas3, partial [Blastocatellia bacterium]|nr:CRISPR-associated helicase/endonuclease Cas3 [Blastocatellia bacterium]